MVQAKFLDVPKTNGLWLVLVSIFGLAVAAYIRRVNVRRGDSPWAFGRMWGMLPFLPIFFVGGIVILIVGH